MTKLSEVQTLAQELDAIGGVDVLINNAGVVFGGVFEQVSLDQHLTTLRVNVEGIVALTHAFLPQLLRAPQANIVNIASASSFIGLPYGSTYAASKWAVLGFSDSLRLELEERGVKNVKLTTVCPGYISTGMFDGAKSPLVMPLLAPDFIVAKIIQGIERDAVYVKEPLIVKTIDTVKGLLPRVVWEQATRLLGVAASMQPWKGHTVAPAPTPASLATAETPAATSGEPAKSKPARAKQRPSVSRRS